MKRWTKRISIAITTLMLFASQAAVALARAGGGKGGSLGGSAGRSFSGGSLSGGGLSGGGLSSGGLFSGGFGGFHFFPFFWGPSLFGGGGGSLFGGFFSLIFILIIASLVIKAFRSSKRSWGRQRGAGKSYGDPFSPRSPKERECNPSPLTPVDVTGRPITNDENLQRFGKAIQFTRENMRYYAETFPRWDREFLVGRVRQVYFWLQDAWTRQDLSKGEEYLSPELLAKYRTDLANMRSRGERNVIKEPMLHPGDVEFIHSHLDESEQHFITMISASLFDYTVDASGRTIAGEDDNRLYFTEFWEFTWMQNQWILSNIYQEDGLEITKIARGDEI